MSRHRTRSFSNPILHKSNSNTTSSTTATKSLVNDPSSDVPASSTMAAAAAAAALRSRPPSFVSVMDVKTKRMLRRKSSASSHGDTGNTSRELQTIRKSSSGSILQRSFCESSSKWSRMPINTPPVPPLPDKIPWKIPESRKESITSGAFYAQKISTQTLNLDNTKLMGSAIRPKSLSHQKLSSSPSTGRMSINFSLPTEYRPNSPATQRKFISPLTADLTSIVSSSNSNSVNYANSRKLISGPELSVSMKVVDKSEESLAKKEGLAQSQARRATIATDKFQGNGSKNAKTTKNVMTRTKRSSTLSVKYPFMTKPSFFSSTNKTLPSNLENTDDQAQNNNNNNENNNNGFQYLKSLEFEKFPSSFSIDREQFNYFNLENDRQAPTNMQKIGDNQYSTDLFPEAKKNPLSPLLIHPAELSNGHALDSIISISNLSLENENQSEHNHASQINDGGNLVDSNQNSDEIMQKYSPIIPTSHFFMKPKCSAANNYLTHSTNHPCKSVLKCTAPSLIFGGSEDFNKVSKDESHLKRTVSRAGLERNPSIVDRKSSAAFNLSSVTETQKVRDRSNPDPEKTKDVSFSMKINEIIKPRPRLPSFGSMRSKKKLEEVEEHRLVKPLESINYTLSPFSPVSPITINTYPSLEMPETDKNKKINNLIISNQVKNENLDNAANIQISKNQPHNHIESTKDYSKPSNYFSGTIETLQNIKSTENLTTLTSKQMSENSKLESKSTVNTPESHLTFLESPTSSTYSQSSGILKTPQTTTITMKFERLHVPGAWDSLNEDLNISQKSDIKLDAETLQLGCNVENQSSINDITNNYTQKANIDISQVLSICEKDSISHKTPENSKIEEDSEAGSIYCDAIENIVIAENSDYSCNNAIFSNSAVYEGEDDGRIQATTENSTDQLHFALPMKSVASQGEKLTNSIVGRLPHRQISDRLTIQPLRNTENNRSFLSSPKFSSEPAAREKYTRSVSQKELHASQEVKVSLPSILIRREESRESVSSFKRAQPIVRELHLRNTMRKPIKPKANKFGVSDLSSSRYKTSSSSLTQTCNLRAASKYYFSKIRKRHTLGLPIDEKIITKNANCLFDSNDSQDFTHPTRKIRLINSSNDDTTNNPKFQNNEVSRLPPEIPNFQARLDDYLDIRSDNYHQFNELPDSSNSFESNKTAGPVSLITKEQNKTTFSTPNFNNQIPIKPKENLISMIRRMKANVNYKVRRQEKEEIMAANTIQDLQDHKSYTLKNQDNSFNFPNYDSEQSPSWPLPTSKNINTEITSIKSPELCIDQKTIVVTDSSPIKRFFGYSDMPSRVLNSTRPDSLHQKNYGSLKRILRRDG